MLFLAFFSFKRESGFPGKDLSREEFLKCCLVVPFFCFLLIVIENNYRSVLFYVPGPVPSTWNKSTRLVFRQPSKITIIVYPLLPINSALWKDLFWFLSLGFCCSQGTSNAPVSSLPWPHTHPHCFIWSSPLWHHLSLARSSVADALHMPLLHLNENIFESSWQTVKSFAVNLSQYCWYELLKMLSNTAC